MEQTTIIPPSYLPMVVETEQTTNIGETIIDAEIITEDTRSPFIEANSQPTTRSELMNDCIIPVYAKDNEVLISHNQFIEATYQAARDFYQGETIAEPEIRVSHIIRGRVPEAINKPASQLLPEDKTMYWERMCFCIEIPSLWQDINGNRLNLSICGVKSYGMENLNGRLTAQKFTFAVGFQNTACCNLCLWTDGYKQDQRAMSTAEIYRGVLELLQQYDWARHIHLMKSLGEVSLSEHQFALLLGRMRLYNYLPTYKQRTIPELLITDSMVNNIAKQYIRDANFKANGEGELSMWNFFNLMTGAVKNGSYIDSFIQRQVNATDIALGLTATLKGTDSTYSWFLS